MKTENETPKNNFNATIGNTVLAEAYSDNWTKVKKYVNKNGWCRIDHSLFPNIEKEFNRHKPYWWRPKSLNGFLGFR